MWLLRLLLLNCLPYSVSTLARDWLFSAKSPDRTVKLSSARRGASERDFGAVYPHRRKQERGLGRHSLSGTGDEIQPPQSAPLDRKNPRRWKCRSNPTQRVAAMLQELVV